MNPPGSSFWAGHCSRGRDAAGQACHTSHLILPFLAEVGAHRTATYLDWTIWPEDATTLHAFLFVDLLEEEAATRLALSCCKSHPGINPPDGSYSCFLRSIN